MRKSITIMTCAIVGALSMTVFADETTYTGKATGHNGEVNVLVTIDDKGRITDVSMGEHSETSGLYEYAADIVPGQIVEHQSVNVDNISGATFTSRAIKNAVQDALEQAGLNPDDYQNAIEYDTEEIEINTDVVIVGAGGAGMSAAYEAASADVDVLVIESNAMVGGSTALSGGMIMHAADAEEKEKYNSLDADDLVEALKTWGSEYYNEELARQYLEHTKENIDWLMEHYEGDDIVVTHDPGWVPLTPDDKEITHTLAISMSQEEADTWADAEGFWITDTLKKLASEAGASFQMSTTATSLLVKDGKVSGVIAEDTHGNTYTIHAGSVILACGGYGANAELKKLYTETDGVYFGPTSNTGFGVSAGEQIGAKLEFAILPDTGGEYGAYVYSTIGGLVINENTEVLDESDEIIDNLFAAGEIACVQTLDPAHFSSGENNGWAIYTGRVAGRKAAEHVQ